MMEYLLRQFEQQENAGCVDALCQLSLECQSLTLMEKPWKTQSLQHVPLLPPIDVTLNFPAAKPREVEALE